ncbi:MAG: transcription elongation factor GreAB [Alphaproteobacteria bacterium]|nr:transcription elongation factor GreAB [Alphaproteobacteria bacterium]
MSRAFMKELDEEVGDDTPEKAQSRHPNLITPAGLEKLKLRIAALAAERDETAAKPEDPINQTHLKSLERDLRYLQGRLERTQLVDPAEQPHDEVAFGATVEVVDDNDHKHVFTIVGEDEADATTGLVSWVSPLARALLKAKLGDVVTWQRPAGDLGLEITAIRYDSARKAP